MMQQRRQSRSILFAETSAFWKALEEISGFSQEKTASFLSTQVSPCRSYAFWRLLTALVRTLSRSCSILTGTRITPMAMLGYTLQELRSRRTQILKSTYLPRLESKDGIGPSLPLPQELSPLLYSTTSTACSTTARISE